MLSLYHHGAEPTTEEAKGIIQGLLDNPEEARKHTKEKKLELKDERDKVTHIIFVGKALDNEVEPVVGADNPTKEYLFVVRVNQLS